MKVTPWPMKTLSSIVTPSQMNVWLEILHRLAHLRVFLDLDECADFGFVPDFAAVEIDEFRQPDALCRA